MTNQAVPARKHRKSLGGQNNLAYLFVAPAILVFVAFVLLPVIMTFVYSFFDYIAFKDATFSGLSNYKRLFSDSIYFKSYLNTFVYVGMTLIVEVAFGLFLAALVDSGVKGSVIFRTAFFAPVMLPGVVVGLTWAFVYDMRAGLLNALLKAVHLNSLTHAWLSDPHTALICICVVSGWVYAGYYMTIFYAAMQRIPRELFEAAKLDGAGKIVQFLKIKLPLTMDIVQVCILLCVTGAFGSFDLFYVMTNGQPNHTTEIVTTWLVRTAFTNQNVGYGSAMAVFLTVFVLFIAWAGAKISARTTKKWEV